MKEAEKTKTPKLIWQTTKLYADTALSYPKLLTGATVSSIFWTLSQDIALPLIFAKLIDTIVSSGGSYSDAYTLLWFALGALIVNFVVSRTSFYFRNPLVTKGTSDLSMKVFDAYQRQEYAFFANSFVGSLVSKAGRFVSTYKDLLDAALFPLLALAIQFIVPIVILGLRAPVLGAIFIVSSLVMLLATILMSRFKRPYLLREAASESRVIGALADSLTNNVAIKTFPYRTNERSIFKQHVQERQQLFDAKLLIAEKIRVVRTVIIMLFQFIVLFALIWLSEHQKITVGTILLAQIYLLNLGNSLWHFNQIMERLEQAMASAAEMTEIMVRDPAVKDISSPRKFNVGNGKIEFNGVQFGYKDGNKDDALFDDLSVTIPAGQKVGLVGPSGGGKTTLTKLLLRFMDIDRGHITIDGQDIAQIRQDDLRRAITYVPQEPLLFHRSIRENIAYGDPSASEQQIREAARLAHADEFIEQLPEGYDTLVGERGVKLSGGEKQRVAIARAMLKNAPILVLDEATSALDSKSEKAIVSALDNLMKNRTTVVIAHRLSTIRKLDRVLVLKNGEIVEDGSHKSLLSRKDGVYAELWHHQSGEFLAEE